MLTCTITYDNEVQFLRTSKKTLMSEWLDRKLGPGMGFFVFNSPGEIQINKKSVKLEIIEDEKEKTK